MRPSVIQIAIVGTGVAASLHAQGMRQVPGVELRGVYSPTRDHRLQFSREFGIRAYPDEGALLGDGQVDAVVLCSPNGLHATQALRVLAAGKHVLIEKPLATRLAAGHHVLDAARSARRVCMTVSQHWFDPAMQVLRRALTGGLLGAPKLAVASMMLWRGNTYFQAGLWRGQWAANGGGTLINQGVHYIDLLHRLFGPPEIMGCALSRPGLTQMEGEEYAVALLKFGHRVTGHFSVSIVEAGNTDHALFSIYGDQGVITLRDFALDSWRFERDEANQALAQDPAFTAARQPLDFPASFQAQIGEFRDAIVSEQFETNRPHHGLEALRVIEALYAKALPLGRPTDEPDSMRPVPGPSVPETAEPDSRAHETTGSRCE